MTALTPRGSTRRWRQLRLLVLDRDGHRCQLPGERPGELCGAFATHVDHVVPRKLGGSDVPANLRAACRSCNLRRGARVEAAPGRSSGPTIGWRW